MKTPKPDDIVLARRLEGQGNVSVASTLPDFKGWSPVVRIDAGVPKVMWDEGACIPMRFIEACERADCEPLDAQGNVIIVGEPEAPEATEEPAAAGEVS